MAAKFTDIAITSKNIDASGQDPSDPKKFIFVFNLSETAPVTLQKLFAEERACRMTDADSSPLALMHHHQVTLTMYPDQNIQLHYDNLKLDLQAANPKYRELLELQERQRRQAARDKTSAQQFIKIKLDKLNL